MQTFTVREIARRVAVPGEDLDAVVDRLRNLTDEGLLVPVGRQAPGTGQRRRYRETEVVKAAVLNRLMTTFGMPASRISGFDMALRDFRNRLEIENLSR